MPFHLRIEPVCMENISNVLISFIVATIISVVLFFTGGLYVIIDSFLKLAYARHQEIRRQQRPKRIFLIRHGESQANVDTSKRFPFNLIVFIPVPLLLS